MECKCNDKKRALRHVQGNTLSLAIALQAKETTFVDGVKQVTVSDYVPEHGDEITVVLESDRKKRYEYTGYKVSVQGNMVTMQDDGTLPVGTYGVEVDIVEAAQGVHRRFYQETALVIVKATKDAISEQGVEFDTTLYSLDAMLQLGLRGSDGKTAYQTWLDQGHEGSEDDFLDWLRTGALLLQETGQNAEAVMSQKAITDAINVVNTELQAKQFEAGVMSFDTEPTEDSENLLRSGAVYDSEELLRAADARIENKIDTLIDGQSAIVRAIGGYKLYKDGFFYAAASYKTVIYDVTPFVGKRVSVTATNANQSVEYMLVKDHTTMIDTTNTTYVTEEYKDDFAANNLLVKGSATSGSSSNQHTATIILTDEIVTEHVADGGSVYLIVTLWHTLTATPLLLVDGIDERLARDEVPTKDSTNLVESGGVWSFFDSKINGNDGKIEPISTVDGKRLNYKSATSGYLYNSGATLHIYDLTSYRGKTIKMTYSYAGNAFKWAIVSDYELLPTTAETSASLADILLLSGGKGYPWNQKTATITIPNSDCYLVLSPLVSMYGEPSVAIAEEQTGGLAGDVDTLKNEFGGLQNDMADVDEIVNGVSAIEEQLTGKFLNSNYAPRYLWGSSSNFKVCIYDVTHLVGGSVTLLYTKRVNTKQYVLFKDYTLIDGVADQTGNILGQGSNNGNASDVTVPSSVNISLASETIVNHVRGGGSVYAIVSLYKDTTPTTVYKIKPLNERLDSIGESDDTTITALNPSYYYLPKIKNMVHTYYGATKEPLLLAHFSDIHADGIRLSRIVDWCSNYTSYISDILHTGDTVNDNYGQGISFWNNVSGAKNILNVIGNHDQKGSSGEQDVTQEQDYSLIFAPYIANWNVVSAGEGLCYYYKDYADSGIRLIAINCMHKGSAQLSWLSATLEDARINGLAVVIASHCCPSSDYTYLRGNFCNPGTSNYIAGFRWEDAATAVETFKGNGGEFICWLVGHAHCDYMGIIKNSQLFILVDSSKFSVNHDHVTSITDKSQDCFNLVAFDTYYKTIKLLRVGNDMDCNMRKIDQCCISYTTNQIISK